MAVRKGGGIDKTDMDRPDTNANEQSVPALAALDAKRNGASTSGSAARAGFFNLLCYVCAVALLCGSCEHGGEKPPAWNEANLASCWDGPSAEFRMMNILSPLMDDATFAARVGYMKSRGANTAHVFLVNKENSECSGYSPWGVGVGPCIGPCDAEVVAWMKRRIHALRRNGFAVVVWVQADDSHSWSRDLALNAADCMVEIANAGLFDDVSTVVAGLEMDEYWGYGEAAAVVSAIRSVWGGMVGVHHTGGRMPFVGLADILFYQTAPGKTPAQIAAETRRALSFGKPVNFFELDRHANRTLCEAALGAGAFGIGNW